MKKKILKFVIIISAIGVLLYLQFGRDIIVCGSINSMSGGQNKLTVDIIANRLYLGNEKAFTEELLDRVENNQLPKIKLSYPNSERYIIYVYRNKYEWSINHMIFVITYDRETGNVIVEK